MVGVLIEVPVMLMLVRICLRTTGWFPGSRPAQPEPFAEALNTTRAGFAVDIEGDIRHPTDEITAPLSRRPKNKEYQYKRSLPDGPSDFQGL